MWTPSWLISSHALCWAPWTYINHFYPTLTSSPALDPTQIKFRLHQLLRFLSSPQSWSLCLENPYLLFLWSGGGEGSFPGDACGKESTCQSRRCGFNSWVRKIPRRRAWQPTPVFLSGDSSWTEEPDGLRFIRSQRVRRDWSNLALFFKFGVFLITI